MKICIVGTGYVGLVTGTCLADIGNEVICIDNDLTKIEALNSGILPIYEPGLSELVNKNCSENRLRFSTDIISAVKESLIIIIAVGTPSREDGSADLRHVIEAARDIALHMNSYKVIVNKSTVPVGTGSFVEKMISETLKLRGSSMEFDVVSNPEFLREGAAIEDFMKPDRVVIGARTQKAVDLMRELYGNLMLGGSKVFIMDRVSSEMTKYVANAMLATRISFINEISNICEGVGADIELIKEGIGSDKRIGKDFLNAGIGYGGSCFPKDVRALIKTSKDMGYRPEILESVEKVNNRQKVKILHLVDKVYGNLDNCIFSIWGLSFKPETNDMREAPSIEVIKGLLERKAKIHVYDPQAMDEAKKIFGDRIKYCDNLYSALEGANALILLTEWKIFQNPDFEKMRGLLRDKVIFDGRNQFNLDILHEMGLHYYPIGRKLQHEKYTSYRRSWLYWQPFVQEVAFARQ